MSTNNKHVHQVRIAFDPHLIEQYGPEIHWAWRLVFTTIGWSWIEVPLDGETPCDIAYVSAAAQASSAQIVIVADWPCWGSPTRRFARIGTQDGLSFPCYEGDQAAEAPIVAGSGRLVINKDLLFDIFWLATGQEERFWPKNDYGAIDFSGAAFIETKAPQQALISGICSWLAQRLQELGAPSPLPHWPSGKRAAAAIGHDVDYPEVIRWLEPARIVARLRGQGVLPALEVLAGRRHHWHFDDWMALEQSLQSRSAFYFVARRGSLWEYATDTPDTFYDIRSKRFHELFRRLIDAGFEVGLHASYRACEDPARFAAEKALLEEMCGAPVIGNRHHYWRLNPADVEETLLIHEQVGFEYDASLTHDRYLGWRRGLLHPFFPFHRGLRRELGTLQIPTGWMDDQLFGGHGRNPGDRDVLLRKLADRCIEDGGCLLIDIHDYVWDERLFPLWRETFRRLWRYLVDRGDFWFATPAEVNRHWRQRYQRLAAAGEGLEAGRA